MEFNNTDVITMSELSEALAGAERFADSPDDRRACPFVVLHTPPEMQADETLINAFDHRAKVEEELELLRHNNGVYDMDDTV